MHAVDDEELLVLLGTPLELDLLPRLLLSGQIMPSEDIKLPFSTVKDPRDLCVHRYCYLLLRLLKP